MLGPRVCSMTLQGEILPHGRRVGSSDPERRLVGLFGGPRGNENCPTGLVLGV